MSKKRVWINDWNLSTAIKGRTTSFIAFVDYVQYSQSRHYLQFYQVEKGSWVGSWVASYDFYQEEPFWFIDRRPYAPTDKDRETIIRTIFKFKKDIREAYV